MEIHTLIHAPAKVAFHGRDLLLQVILPDEAPTLSLVEVAYTVTGKESDAIRLRMLPCDGYRAEESYTVYAATLPGTSLQAGELLIYRFFVEGEASTVYTVPLQPFGSLPPLIITKLSAWTAPRCRFVELQNLTDGLLDLYEYELLLKADDGTVLRNPLADRPGQNLLPAGALAALRFLPPDPTEEGSAPYDFSVAYPEIAADLAEREPLFFRASIHGSDGTVRHGCFDLFYQKYYGKTLSLLPRGDNPSAAFYTVRLRYTDTVRDIRYRRAALWRFDPADPGEGKLITATASVTPGYPCATQPVFDAEEAAVPAILPLAPAGRVYLASGDLALRFAVIGGGAQVDATVFLREGEGFLPHAAHLDETGAFSFVVPFSQLARQPGSLAYYIEAAGSVYTAQLGSEAAPRLVCLTDNCGPEILSQTPAAYQVLENDFTPEIHITYHDISGVNTRISTLCLDGLNVSHGALWREDSVAFLPPTPLSLGTHTVELTLRDMLGNRTYHKYEFAIDDGSILNLYCGQVHSHTEDSDGLGTPEEAYRYAYEKSGMDFFAVTEHTHCYALEDYQRQQRIANAANRPGKFAAIYGFEMSWTDQNGFFGHTNLLNADWVSLSTDTTDLAAYNKLVAADPACVAMFNHPSDTWGNAKEFAWFDDETAQRYALIEIKGSRYDTAYAYALSKGWRVAPLYNEDNHGADWGDSGTMGFVLAPALTRENILDAMRRRRTYSTTDRTMQVRYRVNGQWLGSVLKNPEKLTVEAEITTASETGIGKIELVSEDNITVASIEPGPLSEFCWRVEIDPDFDYYYLRITNGNAYTVTAPVFVEVTEGLSVTRMGYGIAEDTEHPHIVTATVKNESDKTLSSITVDFYLTGERGFTLRSLAPFEEVHLGKLAPGESRTVSRRFPDIKGCHRVSAVAAGLSGKQRFADTAYMRFTPLTISKLMPLTSPLVREGCTVENPYPYVELYNHTAMPIELCDYTLALWCVKGQAPDAAHTLSLSGYRIPPASTLVIWIRPKGVSLTAADFNAHYGTKLLEGEDLMITDVPILLSGNHAQRLDLCRGKEVLTRAPFGYHWTHDTDVVADLPLCYRAAAHRTVRQKFLPPSEGEKTPLPGRILPTQVPKTLNGLCRKHENMAAQRDATRNEVFTRLTKASLVPIRAASFVANAVSAFKGFFDFKE